jgi:nucleoside-diphosphate-sugar epimerase
MKAHPSILITGGCGFIGHHLALELSRRGENVTVFDDFRFTMDKTVYRHFIETRLRKLEAARVPIIRGDATDVSDLAAAFERVRPEKVVHLAAIVSAAVCDRDPDRGFEINVHATQKILEILRRSRKIEQFVFPSSSIVYGNFPAASVTEETPAEPIGVYGAGKLACEHMIKAYHNIYGINYTIIRPSALYGPTCINRRVSQLFIEAALEGRKLTLEGGGEDRLDFTYIDDLVEGLILILTNDNALNQTFNLTYGESRTLKELAGLIQIRFPGVEIETKPWKSTVPHRGTLDVEKARRLLGYAPHYPLERGYPLYMDWYETSGYREWAAGEKPFLTGDPAYSKISAPLRTTARTTA